ncbi:MAG: hypothetical protein U0350_08090 [Caldilineaceae bacterium]
MSEAAPFFFTDAQCSLLPVHTLIFSRQEFIALHFDLSYQDSYTTYAVKREGCFVALLRPNEFAQLPIDVQTELLATQWALGRGQIYAWDDVKSMLDSTNLVTNALNLRISTTSGDKLVLDSELWSRFPPMLRTQWLASFIEMQASSYRPVILTPSLWTALMQESNPIIAQLANTFAFQSGPNCFATTLAALTPHLDTAMTISALWLHQAPFLRTLAILGYRERTDIDPTDPQLHAAVLVWWNQQDNAQHACYVIGKGIALNKNAQAWYAPRQLVHVNHLLHDWQEDQLRLAVYTR